MTIAVRVVESLRERIRELEAELASVEYERRSLRLLWKGAQVGGDILRARAEKAEARVAELAAAIRRHGPCGPDCRLMFVLDSVPFKVLDEIEAREREEG